jgi:anti-sigma factor RsiW
MEHVRADLSAYLDGALAAARRSEVDAHLGTCPSCRASLAELRASALLIGALPAALPSRNLVPALAPRMNWLRPLRSFSAVAAGMFVLAFMASATLDTGFRMGGGGAPTSAAGGAAAQPASAPRSEFAGPPPAAGSPGPQLSDAQRSATALQATAAPRAAGEVATDSAASPPRDQGVAGAPGTQEALDAPDPLRLGPSPWFWLALAALSALLALFTHRRLRAR